MTGRFPIQVSSDDRYVIVRLHADGRRCSFRYFGATPCHVLKLSQVRELRPSSPLYRADIQLHFTDTLTLLSRIRREMAG